MTTHTINGIRLPASLLRLMQQGRWKAPSAPRVARVFGEHPVELDFYSLEEMAFENQEWPTEQSPEYCGRCTPGCTPGDIDPRRSILIGDLGPDRPFALDFRATTEEPRVVYLGTDADCWVTVADSIDDLAAKLGL